MNAPLIAKALQRLKDQQSKANHLQALGVNTTEYDDPYVNIIEELICDQLSQNNQDKHDQVIEDVLWWIEESTSKALFLIIIK
jgi:hypothetical protein